MLVNNLGFIFECREDANGAIGVMEKFSITFNGESEKVDITIAVDNNGKIVMPAINNTSLGFKPLSSIAEDKESLERFIKSNKPYFGKLNEIAMIVSGTIVYNKVTGEVVSTDNLNFYVPKTVSKNIVDIVDFNGKQQPAVVCEKLSYTKGFNFFEVSQLIYNSYLKNFLDCISAEVFISKFQFLSHILSIGGR